MQILVLALGYAMFCQLPDGVPAAVRQPERVEPTRTGPTGLSAAEKVIPPPFKVEVADPSAARAPALGSVPAAAEVKPGAVSAVPEPSAAQEGSADQGNRAALGRPVPGRLRLTPVDLVAEALSLPQGSALTGQPLSLLTVAATAQDRRQQSEAIHAYWRLTEAIAHYRFCVEHEHELSRLQAKGEEAVELRLARAISNAAAREAEVEVVAAQHTLAVLMQLPSESPLPLPADRPHVGPYRTYFAELFSTQPAPERARLIDRTLPLRERAIESHAAAVLAAEEAHAAAVDALAMPEGRLSTVLTRAEEQLRQRRALMASVCRYNHDIADYALAVASPNATAETLVGMLIKQGRDATRADGGADGGGVPASFEQPLGAPPHTAIQPGKNWPTRAVRPAAKAEEGTADAAPAASSVPAFVPGLPPVSTTPPAFGSGDGAR